MGIVSGILLLIFGLVSCFFGTRLYRIILGIQAGLVTIILVVRVFARAGQSGLLPEVIALIAGLVIGFIFYQYLYKSAIILFGVLLGILIAAAIEVATPLSEIFAVLLVVVGAVVGGLIGNWLANFIIQVSTALSGAMQAVAGFIATAATSGITLPLVNPMTDNPGLVASGVPGLITVVIVVVLASAGYAFQQVSAKS